jgi:hypothetical protein
MIFILTTLIFILGVGFHVTRVIDKLRIKFPTLCINDILNTFFKEEWNTLFRSALVLCTYELFLFIIQTAEIKMPGWWEKFLVPYGLALVLGYAGQRLIYKYLGTAESVLEKQVDDIKNQL